MGVWFLLKFLTCLVSPHWDSAGGTCSVRLGSIPLGSIVQSPLTNHKKCWHPTTKPQKCWHPTAKPQKILSFTWQTKTQQFWRMYRQCRSRRESHEKTNCIILRNNWCHDSAVFYAQHTTFKFSLETVSL